MELNQNKTITNSPEVEMYNLLSQLSVPVYNALTNTDNIYWDNPDGLVIFQLLTSEYFQSLAFQSLTSINTFRIWLYCDTSKCIDELKQQVFSVLNTPEINIQEFEKDIDDDKQRGVLTVTMSTNEILK